MSESKVRQHWLTLSAMTAMGLVLAGCGTAPADQGVSASTASVGSGTFPNLNVPLVPATAQITPEERAATASALSARRVQSSAPPPASSAAQMRQIGSTHAQETIRRIEGN